MPEELIKFLATIGGFTIIVIIIFVGVILKETISDGINKAKWKYKRKHRFDKPPTAKCYCIDCYFYDPDNKECHKFSSYMADNEFCSGGEPKNHE